MNPYLLLASGLVWAASLAGTAWWFYDAGRSAELATQAREERAALVASDAAASAAAAAIAKIEVKHVTVRQQLEREVNTREVFRECRSGADAVRMLNAAPGIAPAASAAGGGQLPAAGAPG